VLPRAILASLALHDKAPTSDQAPPTNYKVQNSLYSYLLLLYSTLLCVTPKRCSPPNFTVTTENEHHHVLYARISRHGFDYVQEYQTPGSQEMIARERCAGVAKNSIQSTRMDSVAGPPQRDYKSRQPNYLPS
jgi:hypothetical protein